MNLWKVIGILVLLIVYIASVLIYIHGSSRRKELQILMDNGRPKSFKTFSFEDAMMSKLQLDVTKGKWLIYCIRTLVISTLIVSFIFLRGIALAGFSAGLIIFSFNDAYKKVIYESGIMNISRVTNFINYFVPHINSGNSADQSLLGYIEYAGDEELAEYYENRDNPDFKLPTHLKQIVDIYDISKYNEERGISDYTYILNELSEDMAQKQVYYNSFVARIGEINPIMWSYYIGVPILIFISFGQTYEFWLGVGGYIVSFVLLILFSAFKFLIFKLQKRTINTIF